MIYTVFAKEFREHLGFVIGLTVTTYIAFLLVSFSIGLEGGDTLSAVGMTSSTFFFVVAAVLCGRFLTREHAANTRIFLGALPLSWFVIVVTKMVLGYVCFVGLTLLCASSAWVYESRASSLPAGLGKVVFLNLLTFASFQYFLLAFVTQLGRYRYIVYILLLMSLITLNSLGWLYMDDLAPLRLVDDRLSSETTVELRSLGITWASSLACLVVSLWVQCWNRGSLASRLAERMSHREKVFVTVVVLGFLYAMALVESKVSVEDYTHDNASVFQKDGTRIEISASRASPERIEALGGYLLEEVESLRDFLGWEELPPLFIGLTGRLDGDEFEFRTYDAVDGIFVQINDADERWRLEAFLSALVRELALHHTANALTLEDRAWILDGFAEIWPQREVLRGSEPTAELALRALYGASHFEERDVQRWLLVKARHGQAVSAALAATLIISLAETHGAEKCETFVQEVLGPAVPADLRALIMNPSVESALRQATGEQQWNPNLWAQWRDLRGRWDALHPGRVDALPRLQGALEVASLSDIQCEVACRWSSGTAQAVEEVSFLYVLSGPRRRLPQPHEPRAHVLESAGDLEVIAETFRPGDRLQWTLEVFVPALNCDVISGWQITEVAP